MLAQNFKSAEELWITSQEYEALIKVLGVLERGEVSHVKNYWVVTQSGEPGFNMNHWLVRTYDARSGSCGTTCCIGGLIEEMYGITFSLDKVPAWLFELFYPKCIDNSFSLSRITVEQAAQALRFCLRTGESPPWKEILGVQ